MTPSGPRLGGTAAYAAATAASLGCRVRLVTAGADLDRLPSDEATVVESRETTTFCWRWEDGRRIGKVIHRAEPLRGRDIPIAWRDSRIWHLAPVAGEVSVDVLAAIPASAFVGITPQGWIRRLGPDGSVESGDWFEADAFVDRADAIVLSSEDTAGAFEHGRVWSQHGAVVAVTRGRAGSRVFVKGTAMDVPVFETDPVDDTGAGDVYATVFFIRLAAGDRVEKAARFASAAAAVSVGRKGADRPVELSAVHRLLSQSEISEFEA